MQVAESDWISLVASDKNYGPRQNTGYPVILKYWINKEQLFGVSQILLYRSVFMWYSSATGHAVFLIDKSGNPNQNPV